ncbi:L-aspartate oxidase [compost metagenome]
MFRTQKGLEGSIQRLDGLWNDLRERVTTLDIAGVRHREAAAMTATARLMYNTAIERTETRGMHKREDFPEIDAAQGYRLISGGLDQVWTQKTEVNKEVVTP